MNYWMPPPRPGVATISRTKDAGNEVANLICLDRNERVSPFPLWFRDLIRDRIDDALLMNYPASDVLYRELSASLGVPENELLLTPGSDGAIKALFGSYIGRGDSVVTLDPSYAMYDVYGRLHEAQMIRAVFDSNLSLDVHFLIDSISAGVRLVFIANPNQPTATMLLQADLHRIAAKCLSVGALLVIDEAYYPFSKTTALPLRSEFPNVAIIRTFSKAAGLAGLRIGYMTAHSEVVRNVFKVRTAYDVNSVAVACALEIVRHPDIVSDYVSAVEQGKEVVVKTCEQLGFVPLPTHTNFLLVRVSHLLSPSAIARELRRRGYLIKGSFDHSGLQHCIRLTLGPVDVMAPFCRVLVDVCDQLTSTAACERTI